MRKTLNTTRDRERISLRFLAAIALIGSLAAFGCTTNKYPGSGEPGMSAPAAGPVAPNATSTPGSSYPGTPVSSMISSSPAAATSASEDAIATLRADEGYRGKVLGPAAPGNNVGPSQSMQQPTGQFVSPSVYANPQVTVNSSISSQATPVIASGAGEPLGGTVLAVPVTATPLTTATPLNAVAAPAVVAARTVTGTTPIAISNAVTNRGTTGVSTVTATPIGNTTAMTTPAGAPSTPMVNTGLVSAAAPASSAAPTPILGTTGPMVQANASAIAA